MQGIIIIIHFVDSSQATCQGGAQTWWIFLKIDIISIVCVGLYGDCSSRLSSTEDKWAMRAGEDNSILIVLFGF